MLLQQKVPEIRLNTFTEQIYGLINLFSFQIHSFCNNTIVPTFLQLLTTVIVLELILWNIFKFVCHILYDNLQHFQTVLPTTDDFSRGIRKKPVVARSRE